MRYRLIDAEKTHHQVNRLCSMLAVSRPGYYAGSSRPASKRAREDMVLLAHIRAEFESSQYVAPCILIMPL